MGLSGRIQGDDRETEMEENLQAIDSMVTNLRNMAVDMNAEVSDQNEQLDRITLKVVENVGNEEIFIYFIDRQLAMKTVLQMQTRKPFNF